jgi:hypothetical protein
VENEDLGMVDVNPVDCNPSPNLIVQPASEVDKVG